jgi:hypothetical protein
MSENGSSLLPTDEIVFAFTNLERTAFTERCMRKCMPFLLLSRSKFLSGKTGSQT